LKKQQLGNETKTPETGRTGRQKGTFFQFTSSDLVYSGNQPSDHLYPFAYIRFYVPEK